MTYVPILPTKGFRYRALSDAIVRDIRSGVLVTGTRLPSSRQLSKWLALHRNTVLRAYADLEAQGWVDTRRGEGTYVADGLPSVPRGHRRRVAPGFTLPPAHLPVRVQPNEDLRFPLVAGQPDLRLLPLSELGRALRRVLNGRGRELVDYGDPAGHKGFRRALAHLLGVQRGLHCELDDLVITRGAQQALFLAAQVLFRPGDRVAVERLGYAPAWDALRLAGAELVPINIDEDGLDVDSLERCGKISGVYLTPHHQYPTGAMLSQRRRRQLLALASKHRWAILEDDYDHEFHWDGPPRIPLAARDQAGVVVYIGTLSKAFAPGLRLGWLLGPRAFVRRICDLRRVVDRQGNAVIEAAVSDLLRGGELMRHVRSMHRVYASRRGVVLRELARLFPDLQVHAPPGGLAVWLRTPEMKVQGWVQRAAEKGVYVASTATFSWDTDDCEPQGLRIGFSALNEKELVMALDRLAAAR